MVSINSVLNRLRQLVTLDDQGAENALPLCGLCLDEIRSRLRKGADGNDMRLAQAAAGLAFYRITLRNAADGEGATSFKAGDVTVTRSPAASVELAVSVRDEALANSADLLEDRDFIFRQVGTW